MKLCECGCGLEVKEEHRFVHGHNLKFVREKTQWKKGQHPSPKTEFKFKCGSKPYYQDHARKIMNKRFGLIIPKWCSVHHIDHNYKNNNPNNLVMMARFAHHSYHIRVNKPWEKRGR